MGNFYYIFSFTVWILAKNISISSSFLSSSPDLNDDFEESIFWQNALEKSSRNLNVTNTTNSPAWINTKKTNSVEIYIFVATLVIYVILLVLGWKKDKKEAKEEIELRIKKRGTPIKLEATKKYIDNNKEFRSFSIIFEDKSKLLEKEVFNLEETEKESNQESNANYEKNKNDYDIITSNTKENKNIKDLYNQQNEVQMEGKSQNFENKNLNAMNEDLDEQNVSLSFLAPDEVYIYKQEKKDEKLTYSIFLAKKTINEPKTSWKHKLKKYHSLLSIFYFNNPRRTRLFAVTLYFFVFIGQMFFIGLFYRDSNPSTVKTINNTDTSAKKKKPSSISYDAEDFFIMLFCVFVVFVIMIIIDLMCLEAEIKENMSETRINKIKKINRKWKIAGLIICWGLMGLFCWVIIEYDQKFEKSVSNVWMVSTIISYVIKFFILSWFEMNLVNWLALLPNKLRNYYERKKQVEDQEIDKHDEAVKEKRRYNEQVQETSEGNNLKEVLS